MGVTYYDSGVNNTGPFGVRLQQKHSGGLYTLYKFYDGLGQLIQSVTYDAQVNGSARDIIMDRQYNAYGQVMKQTMPYDVSKWGGSAGTAPYRSPSFTSDKTTITTYDKYGRVTQVASPTAGEDVEYFYNQDLTVVTRNAKGYDTTTVQDIWGRAVETRPPSDPWLRYTYDTADRLVSVEKRTGSGNGTLFGATTMNYDMAGRKTSMNDMDMGAWSYGYDALGNLTSQTDARGCTTTLTYNDGLSRLTAKSYSGSCGVTTSAVTYGYDATTPNGNKGRGQRTSMSDGSGSTVWEYGDNRGRLTKETKTITGGSTFVTQWAYDSGDQVTSMTYPDNETVTYSYLPQLVVNSVMGSSTYVQSSQYDAAGRVELRKFGADQIRTDYKYRAWNSQGGRLEWTRSGTPNGSTVNATLQDFTYSYDPNVLSIVDALAGGAQTQSFGYDTLDRLTSAGASGGAGGTYSQSYSYDANGRLSTGPLGSGYSYDVSRKHEVAQVGSNSFGYDLNGNMTTRTENGSSYTQNYDAENRLVSVTGAATANFVYDADGNRAKGEINGQTTFYVGNHYEENKALCKGQTTPGNTNWQAYNTNGIYLDIDTSACGFTTTPLYFTSLGGNDSHWVTTGATAIYSPSPTGFRVYVRFADGSALSPANANAWLWHINWTATARSATNATFCTGQTPTGSSNWQAYTTTDIYLDIDTSACGFSTTPLYQTSLGGAHSHWIANGATAIYFPTATGFRVYVRNTTGTLTPADANAMGWQINWQATPNATNSNGLCTGRTTPGSTNWQTYSAIDLYVDVDTSGCNLGTTPLYLTSLGGSSSHWVVTGATAIYFPTSTGFRVYVRYIGSVTPADANANGWHINWSAVSNNVTLVRKYYYAGSQRVAMRENGTLRWLLGDHLGSTAYTVNGATETGEVRYFPWGKDRFTSGQTLTSYKFTGQREESGLGFKPQADS